MAAKIVRMPSSSPPIGGAPREIRRKCAPCEEEAALQTKSIGSRDGYTGSAPPAVHRALRSPGEPLAANARAFFEPRLGHDFSNIRVHADSEAAASAKAINAGAYTVGNDVVFAAGAYAPSSEVGRELLAHELVHVLQQGASPSVIRRQAATAAPKKDGDDQETTYHATRDVLRDFLVGTALGDLIGTSDRAHVYGPDHAWTKELRGHPHMAQVREKILRALEQYCKNQDSPDSQAQKPSLMARDDFNLNSLSFGQNAAWLFNDALNWMTWGALGHQSGYLFGSFRLAWQAKPQSCDKGLGSAMVKFYAWDVAHVGSAIRVPMTDKPVIDIKDQPLGKGMPLNDVPIAWYWSTQYIFSY